MNGTCMKAADEMKHRRHHSLAWHILTWRESTRRRQIRNYDLLKCVARLAYVSLDPNQTHGLRNETESVFLLASEGRPQPRLRSHIEIHTIVNSIVHFCRAGFSELSGSKEKRKKLKKRSERKKWLFRPDYLNCMGQLVGYFMHNIQMF